MAKLRACKSRLRFEHVLPTGKRKTMTMICAFMAGQRQHCACAFMPSTDKRQPFQVAIDADIVTLVMVGI